MSLILIDGFDHYGDDETKMTEGVYEQVGSEFSISSTNPRTGAKCIRRSTAVSDDRIVFDLQEDKETIAVGMAIYPSALPSADSAYAIFSLVDSNDADNITFIVDENGSIKAVLNDVDGMEVITTDANIIQAAEYQHIEIAVRADSAGDITTEQTIDENFVNGLDDYVLTGPDNYTVSGDEITITGDAGVTDSNVKRTFSLGVHTLVAIRFNFVLSFSNIADSGIILVHDQNGDTIFQFFPRVETFASSGNQRAALITQTNFITSSPLSDSVSYSFSGQFTESGLVYELRDSDSILIASGTDTTSTADRTLGALFFRSDNDVGGGGEKVAYSNVELDIEFIGALDPSGIIEIRHNGVTVASGSSLDTTGTDIQSYRKVSLRLGSASAFGVQTDVDDYFIWDDQGVWNNSFLGDRRCYLLKPNGDTNVADFDPSSGSFGYKMIDDDSPDDDSTYVIAEAYLLSGSPLSGSSEYNLENLSSGSSLISGLNVITRAAKTDSTSAEIYTSIVSGSDTLSADAHTLTTSYAYYSDIFEYDPSTISSFTRSQFNGLSVSITADNLDSGISIESPTIVSPGFISPTDTGSATPYYDEVIADSPLAYYRHKETSGTTIDNEGSIGSIIDGTTSGSPTLAQPSLILDDGDTSILFDGTDDYYLTPTNGTLGTTNTTNRVLECWVQFTTTATTKTFAAFRGNNTASTGEYLILIANFTSVGHIGARSGGVNFISSSSGFNDGNPHYVVVEKLNTTINLYIDDVLEATGTRGTLSGSDPMKLAIGVNYGTAPTAGQYFPGYIDEVAVYETLSASRRTAHYNAGI